MNDLIWKMRQKRPTEPKVRFSAIFIYLSRVKHPKSVFIRNFLWPSHQRENSTRTFLLNSGDERYVCIKRNFVKFTYSPFFLQLYLLVDMAKNIFPAMFQHSEVCEVHDRANLNWISFDLWTHWNISPWKIKTRKSRTEPKFLLNLAHNICTAFNFCSNFDYGYKRLIDISVYQFEWISCPKSSQTSDNFWEKFS